MKMKMKSNKLEIYSSIRWNALKIRIKSGKHITLLAYDIEGRNRNT